MMTAEVQTLNWLFRAPIQNQSKTTQRAIQIELERPSLALP